MPAELRLPFWACEWPVDVAWLQTERCLRWRSGIERGEVERTPAYARPGIALLRARTACYLHSDAVPDDSPGAEGSGGTDGAPGLTISEFVREQRRVKRVEVDVWARAHGAAPELRTAVQAVEAVAARSTFHTSPDSAWNAPTSRAVLL